MGNGSITKKKSSCDIHDTTLDSSWSRDLPPPPPPRGQGWGMFTDKLTGIRLGFRDRILPELYSFLLCGKAYKYKL